MKKLIILILATTLTCIKAEETANLLANQVIHNYKSVPLKISGRQPGGKLCLWNSRSKKWSCSETDIIPTGSKAILLNPHKRDKGGWWYPTADHITQTSLRGDTPGHAIVTDIGEVEDKTPL